MLCGTGVVGIDLGQGWVTCSDGLRWEAARPGGWLRNRALTRKHVSRTECVAIHVHIQNRRSEMLHQFSREMVEDNAAIFIGNVSSSRLSKTRPAKFVLDAGWSPLRTLPQYKVIAHGVVFEEIDEAYTPKSVRAAAL